MTASARDATQIKLLAIISLVIGVATVVVFNVYPQLDIYISKKFYVSDSTFAYRGGTFLGELRRALMVFYYVWYALCIGFAVYGFRKQLVVMGLNARAWQFQIICSILGPGVLVNGILKEVWGRARPREISEFGRDAEFTTVLSWSDQCSSNCSFVSGESSAMFMIFASLALVSGKYRGLYLVLMVLAGGFVSLMRVGQGGHFTSDCIMAGVLMMLVACGVYWTMYLRKTSET